MYTQHRDGTCRPSGFSLVEVMVGFAILGITATGLVFTALQGLRSAHQNVMRTTAFATAQSFLEQIKVIPEEDLRAALAAPTKTPLPTRSLRASSAEVMDPIYLSDPSANSDGENHKSIVVDLKDGSNGQQKEVIMDMWFDVDITRFGQASGYFISMDFTYEIRGIRYVPRHQNSLRLVRASEWANK